MAFIPVPNCWQLTLEGLLPGSGRWVTNWYVELDTYAQPDTGGANAFAGLIQTAIEASQLDDHLATTWTWDTLTVTGIDASTDGQVVVSNPGVTGHATSGVLPDQTCGLVQWQTALRGQSYRGRTYLPGFTEADNDASAPTAGLTTVLLDFGAALINELDTGTAHMVIVSRFSGTELVGGPGGQTLLKPKPRAVGISTEVIAATSPGRWATQRRRARV